MRWRVNFRVHLPSDSGGSGDTFTKSMDVHAKESADEEATRDQMIVKARAKLDKYLKSTVSEFHFPKLEITVKSTQKVEP